MHVLYIFSLFYHHKSFTKRLFCIISMIMNMENFDNNMFYAFKLQSLLHLSLSFHLTSYLEQKQMNPYLQRHMSLIFFTSFLFYFLCSFEEMKTIANVQPIYSSSSCGRSPTQSVSWQCHFYQTVLQKLCLQCILPQSI